MEKFLMRASCAGLLLSGLAFAASTAKRELVDVLGATRPGGDFLARIGWRRPDPAR